MAKITSIQFKRGNKDALELKLAGDNKPKQGEPIWELDTNFMKLGDGVRDYADLPYLGATESLVLEGYLVQDATHDVWYKDALHTQILIKWKNKLFRDLTLTEDDEPSNLIYYIAEDGTSTQIIQIANAKRYGLVKLYGNSGQNTDGAMTQKAVTDAIDAIKLDLKDGEEDVMVLKKPW